HVLLIAIRLGAGALGIALLRGVLLGPAILAGSGLAAVLLLAPLALGKLLALLAVLPVGLLRRLRGRLGRGLPLVLAALVVLFQGVRSGLASVAVLGLTLDVFDFVTGLLAFLWVVTAKVAGQILDVIAVQLVG